MSKLFTNEDYKTWLVDLKTRIKQSQIKAALAVNSQLIRLYWDLGSQIVEKQKTAKWGSGFIDQLSKDLQEEFPTMDGFSRSNLYSMRQFFLFYSNDDRIVHQLGGQTEDEIIEPIILQIPWRHHVSILQKIKNQPEASFYLKETIENNWSRAVLEMQIETNLYGRQGRAITNSNPNYALGTLAVRIQPAYSQF